MGGRVASKARETILDREALLDQLFAYLTGRSGFKYGPTQALRDLASMTDEELRSLHAQLLP